MPFVTVEHLTRLLDRNAGPETLIASTDGIQRMPPALFGSNWFGALEALSGDRGARALLDRAETVPIGWEELFDVDTTDDLRESRERWRV